MKASEAIEKLSKLPPGTPILVDHPGCGCCSYGYGEAVLVRETGGDGEPVYRFAHRDEVPG